MTENQVRITINMKNFSNGMKDWELYFDKKKEELLVKITYYSGKYYNTTLSDCEITPFRKTDIKKGEILLANGEIRENVVNFTVYGEKYAVLEFNNSDKVEFYKKEKIEVLKIGDGISIQNLNYFKRVAEIKDRDPKMPSILKKQLDCLQLKTDCALYAYFSKTSKKLDMPQKIIYPFGLNISQKSAVEAALSSQICIIQGPPGTGKTQTILNIIANIITSGKTVAVVSNNHEAVVNVFQKMEKVGLEYIIARLGSEEKKKNFFSSLPQQPKDIAKWKLEEAELLRLYSELNSNLTLLEELYEVENRKAKLQQELRELNAEQNHYEDHVKHREGYIPNLLPFYKFSNRKIFRFVADEVLSESLTPTFFNRAKYFFYYGIYDFKLIDNQIERQKVVSELQRQFYIQEKAILENELEKIELYLKGKNFEKIKQAVESVSMMCLKHNLFKKCEDMKEYDFQLKDYKKDSNFEKFIERFPVVLSTAFSLMNSIPKGYLFDYLIVDEASQLELVPAVNALGCAKNVVIVGDAKQLPHIPNKNVTEQHLDSCFDYRENSLLSSVTKIFQNKIPEILLKEHYRCDPMIIHFCNQLYYDGELIALSSPKDDHPLILVKTSKGNHMRSFGGKNNVREIESLNEEALKEKVFPPDYKEIGFIAPYRKQINTAEPLLGGEIVKNTVHKFQGKECDGIIFSTVLDKKGSKKDFAFVDDSNLVNVAISRAKRRFVLVSDVEAFRAKNGDIAALIRYMEYYTEASLVHESNVVSAFDLLYREFSDVLIERKNKLRNSDSKYKSERIIASLLRDIFSEEAYSSFDFIREYRLLELIKSENDLNEDEITFINNGARCDFLIQFKIGFEVAAVIEVDGTKYHNESNIVQFRRDSLKDSILEKAGIPLLRLRTNESGESEKIKKLLDKAMRGERIK